MKRDAEDTIRFVEIEIDVKFWKKSLPRVGAARPGRCPCCRAAGVAADGRVVLHGHGVRVRQQWGPTVHDARPEVSELPQRRYLCTKCGVVVVVRPRGLLSRKRYTAAAIALALWLWAGEMQTDAQVRASIGVRPTRGVSRPERWTTLRRWAAAAGQGELWACVRGDATWTLRQCARRAARIVEGFGDVMLGPGGPRVFAGAGHAR